MLSLMRTWYLASFCPLSTLADELECDLALLEAFISDNKQYFGAPRAMALQNKFEHADHKLLRMNSSASVSIDSDMNLDNKWKVTATSAEESLNLSFIGFYPP